MDVAQFVEAVRRVASGGTVMDPEVVSQLVIGRERDDAMRRLTPREREVLALMAEGRSNAAIAAAMVVSEKAVSKHIANIFLKLDMLPSDDDNRRVMAVLAYLNA
jgi:DNA-binding NarL/FixJ family response regulator